MGSLSQSFSLLLIIILAVSSLTLMFATIPFGLAQSGTNVSGIIASNTTWTQTNSPYRLTGPVAVNQGVTLTIDAGVTVDLGYYYMQVNGTLNAKGTSTNQIYFNDGNSQGITFTAPGNGWNEQSETGCIIQNAIINPPVGASTSIKLDHDTFLGALAVGNSSSITNSNIEAGVEVSDEAVLFNNEISGAITPPYPNGLTVSVSGGIVPDSVPSITNNIIHSGTTNIGISCYGYAAITNNTVTGAEEGIRIYSSPTSGYPIIKKNTLTNNQEGIVIRAGSEPANNSPTIEYNLITNSKVGISIENYGGTVTPTIQNNNLYNNNVNLVLELPINLDAINNWWGTTEQQAINATISDFKNNFNYGTVNFIPFLTAPDPQALPNPTAPTQNSAPLTSQTSTPTPTVPEFPTLIFLLLFTVMVSTSLLVYIKTHKN
jgi:Periplasmic copper-binding protein (NosD)